MADFGREEPKAGRSTFDGSWRKGRRDDFEKAPGYGSDCVINGVIAGARELFPRFLRQEARHTVD